MFLGLFQYTIDVVVDKAVQSFNLSTDAFNQLSERLEPVQQASNIAGFLLTSIFVYFFALFQCATKRGSLYFLALRLFGLLLYTPLLAYCGAYLDAAIVGCTLLWRFAYTGFYAWRYSNILFIILNSTTLCFLNGKATHFSGGPYSVLHGGDHYIMLGGEIVPYVSRKGLYLAIRGSSEEDLPLLRTVELLDGNFLYVFSKLQVVGITNSAFEEIQLDDYATISE
nr:MAG: ORF3 [Pekapeka alphacoronavirus 1]WPA70779.1 MAG: ORF3 [Pekapeka alphacoronavirus 2]